MALTEYEKIALRSFVSLAFYNGYEDDINDIMYALKTATKLSEEDKYYAILRPNWQRKCGRDKIDEFGGIFWSWLVLTYGEYGTSPRFGWLYPEKATMICEALQDIKQDYE